MSFSFAESESWLSSPFQSLNYRKRCGIAIDKEILVTVPGIERFVRLNKGFFFFYSFTLIGIGKGPRSNSLKPSFYSREVPRPALLSPKVDLFYLLLGWTDHPARSEVSSSACIFKSKEEKKLLVSPTCSDTNSFVAHICNMIILFLD